MNRRQWLTRTAAGAGALSLPLLAADRLGQDQQQLVALRDDFCPFRFGEIALGHDGRSFPVRRDAECRQTTSSRLARFSREQQTARVLDASRR